MTLSLTGALLAIGTIGFTLIKAFNAKVVKV
jgi:hypothetical protein